MSDRIPELEGVVGTCARCSVTRIDLGDTLRGDASNLEILEQMEPKLNRAGWIVRDNEDGQREIICPGCAKEIEAFKSVALLPFKDGPCRKCGSVDVSATFCDGRPRDCSLRVPRDHMEMACKRCGFRWVTATADESRPVRRVHPAAALFFWLAAIFVLLVLGTVAMQAIDFWRIHR